MFHKQVTEDAVIFVAPADVAGATQMRSLLQHLQYL